MGKSRKQCSRGSKLKLYSQRIEFLAWPSDRRRMTSAFVLVSRSFISPSIASRKLELLAPARSAGDMAVEPTFVCTMCAT